MEVALGMKPEDVAEALHILNIWLGAVDNGNIELREFQRAEVVDRILSTTIQVARLKYWASTNLGGPNVETLTLAQHIQRTYAGFAPAVRQSTAPPTAPRAMRSTMATQDIVMGLSLPSSRGGARKGTTEG